MAALRFGLFGTWGKKCRGAHDGTGGKDNPGMEAFGRSGQHEHQARNSLGYLLASHGRQEPLSDGGDWEASGEQAYTNRTTLVELRLYMLFSNK